MTISPNPTKSFWKDVMTVWTGLCSTAIFPWQQGGGFRHWWRQLTDSDQSLNQEHLRGWLDASVAGPCVCQTKGYSSLAL